MNPYRILDDLTPILGTLLAFALIIARFAA